MGSENRVIKVFQVLVGGDWAGGAAVVHPFAERLVQDGYDVSVLCLTDKVSERFEEIGATILRPNHWKREINLSDALAFLELIKFCRQYKFDIVHTHTSKGGFLGRIAARLAGTPIVIHSIHGFTFNELSPRKTKFFYTTLEKIADPFCDALIAVADEHRQRAISRKMTKPEKIITIQNGINVERFTDLQNLDETWQTLPCPENSVLVGCVGRLVPEKGMLYLLEAASTIVPNHPHTHFLFVGQGPQEEELKQYAADLGIETHCHFLGFRADVPKLLNLFDIFVLPSLREGLSIALLEAMASACPVIACDISGNRELVTDGVDGLLVEAANADALADGLTYLLEDRAFAEELGAEARRTVQFRFSEAVMIDQTLALYDACLQPYLDESQQVFEMQKH